MIEKLTGSVGKVQGFKTYAVMAALMVVQVLGDSDVISNVQVEDYSQLLYYLGGATLAAKLNRMAKGPSNP